MASNARNLSKLLGTSTQVPTTALPTAIADLETVGQTLSDGEIAPSSIKSNTLTQSFDSNQAVTFNMADSIDAVSPILSVFKEVPQAGFSSKGQWDVNANATNYEFFDEKSISYSSANLTPSATGDGTFTNSAANTTYYDVANATYDSVSNAQYTQANGVYSTIFNNNGTKAYATAHNSSGDIYQYSLSTAYDVSTNTYDNKTYSFSQFTYPTASRFNGDGTKLYTVAWNGSANSSRIWQYSLSTAYDISTASYDSVNLNLTAHNFAWGFTFNNDGSKVFVSIVDGGGTGGRIAEYSLSTNYDLSTAGSQTLYVLSGTGWANYGIEFNNDGTKLFVNNNDDAPTKGPHIFTLSTAYDISTVSYTNTSADVTTLFGGTTGAADITFNNNGSKMYISDSFNGYVRQFSVSTSTAFNEADVGKKVVGNSGSAIITATSGTYKSVAAFADTSAISSWQLFGTEGKSDGSGIKLSGHQSLFNISSSTLSYTWNTSSFSQTLCNMSFKPDGTRVIIVDMTLNNIVSYNLSTPWDLSTATAHHTKTGIQTNNRGIYFKSDGISVWISNASEILSYTLSTAWDISSTWTNTFQTMNSTTLQNHTGHLKDIHFSSDGTKFYLCDFANRRVTEWDCSTAFRADTATYNNVSLDVYYNSSNIPMGMEFSSDGTVLLVISEAERNLLKYNLSTAWDLSTATYDSLKAVGSSGSCYGLGIDTAGENFYVTIPNVSGDPVLQYYAAASNSAPYSQYMPALTNSSNGQINSSSWLDINSMTADETKNGGDIFYAVSTDNRTSWSVAKASDGVRKIAKNNSGTWQYNNNAGTNNPWQYNSGAASGNTLTISSAFNNGSWISGGGAHNSANVKFSPDGTKIFWAPGGGNSDADDIYTANLSTAWDLSTASQGPVYTEYSSSGYGQTSFAFNSDGTKLYTVVRVSTSSAERRVRQWSLSTAYDVSTSSYVGVSISGALGSYSARGLYVAPDESYFITIDLSSGQTYIKKWNLATAGDITSTITGETAVDVTTYTNWSAPAVGSFYATAPDFFDSGNKMVIVNHGNGGSNTNDAYLVELSTAYDITSGTVIGKFTTSTGSDLQGVGIKPDGTKLYAPDGTGGIVEFNTGSVQFTTSETWVNGTNNNEHATLQQALGAQSFNRMNKAQLDAVADGYHFSQDSADTLDLMIAPYAASGTSPISDGVTINYDAEALIREAIPGTDYIAEFPNPNKLNITAVGAANLKIRAQ
jgi:6-phosphogluconolactonase (cycloisomerase 2 family)